ncbi:hypothetical protein [Salininema proteolyticum]|uniref:DUF883 domain-containing protein n=1 Tax=Salininema proteolyticum TaxID=1607685 RepID=A0ABV8U0W3_9ACTN
MPETITPTEISALAGSIRMEADDMWTRADEVNRLAATVEAPGTWNPDARDSIRRAERVAYELDQLAASVQYTADKLSHRYAQARRPFPWAAAAGAGIAAATAVWFGLRSRRART